jgi:hypothetical protein
MKDLILISNYSDTPEKQDILRNLVNQIYSQKEFFDLLLVSHTTVPEDIQSKCNYALYDYKNELLYDLDLRNTSWFNPENQRRIISAFTGYYNTHLAIWRMIILGNSLAKNLGYNKIHHIEYDASITDFTELIENSKLLDKNNSIYYIKSEDTVDDILFGSYQAYRLDYLPQDLLVLNEDKLKQQIRSHYSKNPEAMLQSLLESSGNFQVKSKSKLDKNNNFGLTHNLSSNTHTAWCLPYYDELNGKLGFIAWNMEPINNSIDVKLIYNEDQFINIGILNRNNWKLQEIDDFKNAKSLTVIVNNKIRNTFDFTKNTSQFKQFSFRSKIDG